ncbi:MAG: right-handed parallel beta-helix repeat-containing protein, partial [Planctomycetota bacterium]|nr:right-handed parallel beta-helix repeat-containing protein [Planctomycetota bacterium]
PGDTVLIKGSIDPASPSAIYDQSGRNGVDPVRPGLPGQPITIASYPGHTVILQGGGGQWGIDLDNASYYIFRGLVFKNYNKAAEGWAVKTDILIEGCEFSQTGDTGVRFRSATNVTMRDCYVHDCFDYGVDLRNSDNVTMERVRASYNTAGQGDGFQTIACGTVNFVDCVATHNIDGFDLNSNSTLTNCVSGLNQVVNLKLWRRSDDNYAEKTYTVVNSLFYGLPGTPYEANIRISAGARLNLYNSVVYGSDEMGLHFCGIGHSVGPAVVTSQIINNIISDNGASWSGGIVVFQSGPNRNDVIADHEPVVCRRGPRELSPSTDEPGR